MENRILSCPEESEFDGCSENYENDRLAVLVRDPNTLYVYWDWTESRRKVTEAFMGCRWEEMRHELRVYDVKYIDFRGEDANWRREVPVDGKAACMFIHSVHPDSDYCVDYGVRTADGKFVTLLRSDPVRTPSDGSRPLERVDTPVDGACVSEREAPAWSDRFDGYTLRDG